MARGKTMNGGRQNAGYLGGDNISMAERHVMRDKYLGPISDFARDQGLHNQCRCGGTRYVRWRARHYCMQCARWVRKLNVAQPVTSHQRQDTK